MKDRKTIIVIGAGIAGLSAAIYAEQNGFHAILLEKNPSVGGLCTGWYRGNRYIDGCIHWLTGTKEDTILYNMWKNVGAINSQDDIIYLDSFGTFDYQGTKVTFWRDLERAEKEWTEISPIDKKQIHHFFKMVKDFIKISLPLDMPFSMMNIFRLLGLGVKVLTVWTSYLLTMKYSCERYVKKFKSPALRFALTHVQTGPSNLFSMIYSYATVVQGDGGIPKGGSKPMVERMKNKLLSLGGTLKLNSDVSHILVNTKGACEGVELINGQKIYGDYVVSALDPNYTLKKLLINRYPLPKINNKFNNPTKYPSPSGILLSFKVKDLPDLPIPLTFETESFYAGVSLQNHLVFRSFAYDKETYVNDDETICNVLLEQYSDDYYYWKELKNESPREYQRQKKMLADLIIAKIEKQIPSIKGKITCLDVATPLTLNRYTNASRGAYMGFLFTDKISMFCHNGKVKGIKNFYLSGQWMQSPGGLPLAISGGKFSIQRICKKENLSIIFDHSKKRTQKIRN